MIDKPPMHLALLMSVQIVVQEDVPPIRFTVLTTRPYRAGLLKILVTPSLSRVDWFVEMM